MPKGLLLQILWGLVLAFGEVNGGELERHPFLVENDPNTLGAGGDRAAVESEDHLGACVVVLGDVNALRSWEEVRRVNELKVVSSYIYPFLAAIDKSISCERMGLITCIW